MECLLSVRLGLRIRRYAHPHAHLAMLPELDAQIAGAHGGLQRVLRSMKGEWAGRRGHAGAMLRAAWDVLAITK